MTYKKYKTGTFRVSVFLTILIEALAFIREDRGYTTILGICFSDWAITVVFKPVFIWSSWFFSLWIYKGFLDLR